MDEEMIQQQIEDDWVDTIYYEDGIKITRYKPSWYRESNKFVDLIRGKSRKPSFGPKDP